MPGITAQQLAELLCLASPQDMAELLGAASGAHSRPGGGALSVEFQMEPVAFSMSPVSQRAVWQLTTWGMRELQSFSACLCPLSSPSALPPAGLLSIVLQADSDSSLSGGAETELPHA